MDFDPINDDHAVQSAIFVLGLDRLIDTNSIRAVQANHHVLRGDLPAIGVPPNIELDPSLGLARGQAGVEFSTLRSDGSPVWLLRLSGSEIVVECSRYTRWEKTWQQARDYMLFACNHLSRINSDYQIASVSLQVVDRFLTGNENYQLSSLLKRNEFVPDFVFTKGPVWHSHIGWFESNANAAVLNRLDIDARKEPYFQNDNSEPVQRVFVNLQHFQQSRLTHFMSLIEIDGTIDGLMFAMHLDNKRLAISLLNDEICSRIGLEVPSI